MDVTFVVFPGTSFQVGIPGKKTAQLPVGGKATFNPDPALLCIVLKIMKKTVQTASEQDIATGFLHCAPKFEKTYRRMGWQKIDANVLMQDERGNTVPIPCKNIVMIYPLKRKDFPAGDVNLAGRDW